MDSQKYFDQISSQWDELRQSFYSENVREAAYAAAGIQSGKTAADIGAGTGFITSGLLKKGLEVIAVDFSEAMLKEMKRKFNGREKIDYRLATSERLPIENESVDYVFANMFLHHVESPEISIKEMTRVLKYGGKVVITDLDDHKYEFLRTEQHDRWLGFRRDDIANWFMDAGLKNVKIDCVGEDCCAESDTSEDTASISIFLAVGEK